MYINSCLTVIQCLSGILNFAGSGYKNVCLRFAENTKVLTSIKYRIRICVLKCEYARHISNPDFCRSQYAKGSDRKI